LTLFSKIVILLKTSLEEKAMLRFWIWGFLITILVVSLGCKPEEKKMEKPLEDPFFEQRRLMVETQILSRGVEDSLVLKAMLKVSRHLFVPESYRELSYSDGPLPIGEGQTISQPYIVALMTELLGLKGGGKVLEIGTGSGYQAAILAEICSEVYTIEIIKTLADRAESTLKSMGYKNITVKCGDGYQGWEEHSPFDEIIVTAAPDHIPQPLVDQLKIGGKMVIPVGDFYQELILITKTQKGVEQKNVIPVRFVPMTGEAERK
jgi:protein-L-isoaspartate(D-aspartate) O-methyltransferase